MEYQADVRSILNRIKEAYNLKNDAELAKYLDVLATRVSNWVSRNAIDYDLIFTKCKDLNFDWLLTGTGEKFRINMIHGDRNPVGNNQGTISGHNIGDNSINISGPTSGKQKIIHPDRTIEIDQQAQDYISGVSESQAIYLSKAVKKELDDKDREISSLKQQVIDLQSDLIKQLKSGTNK